MPQYDADLQLLLEEFEHIGTATATRSGDYWRVSTTKSIADEMRLSNRRAMYFKVDDTTMVVKLV